MSEAKAKATLWYVHFASTQGCNPTSRITGPVRLKDVFTWHKMQQGNRGSGKVILLSKLEAGTVDAVQSGLLHAATAAVLADRTTEVARNIICICQGLRAAEKGLQLQVNTSHLVLWPGRCSVACLPSL